MNSYMLYQAESVKSARELREADVRTGELAQSFARLRRSLLPARRHPGAGGSAEPQAIRHSCVTPAC